MVDESALPEPITPERLEALGEEIATFAARIDVAEHALITGLRLFDAHEAWGPAGFKSCAEWLSWRIGIGITAAREKVRVARALATLQKVDALFGRGELSYSKVRAITRVATPTSEQDFIDVALHATASQIERLARAYQRVRDAERGPMELPRNHRRFVRQRETIDGMVRIEIQLPPEQAAIVWEAMLSAMDQERAPARAEESAGACAGTAAQAPAEASAAQDSATARDPAAAHAPAEAQAVEPAHDSAAAHALATARDPAAALAPAEAQAVEPAHDSAAAHALATARDPAAALAPAEAQAVEPAQDSAAAHAPATADASAEARAVSLEQAYTIEERCADAIVDVARAYLQQRPPTLGSGPDWPLGALPPGAAPAHARIGLRAGGAHDQRPARARPRWRGRLAAQWDAGAAADGSDAGGWRSAGRRGDGRRWRVARRGPADSADSIGDRSGAAAARWRVPGAGMRAQAASACSPHSELGGQRADQAGESGAGVHWPSPNAARRQALGRGSGSADCVSQCDGARDRERGAFGCDERVEQLERYIRAAGLHVDADTVASRWDGSKVALAELLDWMFIAEHARAHRPAARVVN